MSFKLAGIVLDLDGLLLDTERVQFEVGPNVLRNMGYDLTPEFFLTLVGADWASCALQITRATGREVKAKELEHRWVAAIDEVLDDSVPLRPGVHNLLDALDRRNIPRAVATNSATARAKWKLQNAGLLDRIETVVGIDMVARGKPAPDVYIAALDALRLDASQCAALDDSDLGVRAALAAGIGIVIQVPDMVASKELVAHHQARSLAHASEILGL